MSNLIMDSSTGKERPKVIKFAFIDFVVKNKSMSARCKFCRDEVVITDTIGTTSNFTKHLQRIHPQR